MPKIIVIRHLLLTLLYKM